MNKITLIHIGIFTAGVAAGWMLAKNQKDKVFANLNTNTKIKPKINGSFEDAFTECFGRCNVVLDPNPQRCIENCLKEKGWNSNTGLPLTTLTNF